MLVDAALVKEQGLSFAVVRVNERVLSDTNTARESMAACSRIFPGIPIILMAQDREGCPSYFGREDIVRFLATVPISALPWKQFNVS